MDKNQIKTITEKAKALIKRSGLVLSKQEWQQFAINDFGLGDIFKEGFQFIDILRSDRLRITIIVFLPHQSIPQHRHPSYGNESGKEETLRVLYGNTQVFIEGPKNSAHTPIPSEKEAYYTAKHKIALDAGQQVTVPPGIKHWFQAGPEGSVNIVFQNRVDETQNIFDDPNSLGCPIKLTD
jgi:D-lyxose ketol-isomerase